MPNKKNSKLNLTPVFIIGIIVFALLSLVLVGKGYYRSTQSRTPEMPQITFVGEYKIGNSEFKPVVKGEHIPANRGDVTLQGYFMMEELDTEDPEKRILEDTCISFYMNHISVTVYEDGIEYPFMTDSENEHIGEDSCGQQWTGYLPNDPKKDFTIVIHNPHTFGNATAVDDFLNSFYVYSIPYFDDMARDFGTVDRGVGIVAVTTAVIVLGIALFSALLHTKYGRELAMVGLMGLFGGVYFLFSSEAVSYWSELIILNTRIKGLSAMFYMLFTYIIITNFLEGRAKKAGIAAAILSGTAGLASVAVSLFTKVLFYDTLFYWALATALGGIILIVCIIPSVKKHNFTTLLIHILSLVLIFAFITDLVLTGIGVWQGGLLSRYVFLTIFILEVIVVLQLVPKNINAVVKAKELESERNALDAQLAESRISTMISQIRPHFIYNTLGSIEQLCELDPKKAGELVHNFAKYLRGNFGELDNPKPILMSQEMEHVKHYISIENVRFPDMTFTFEMNTDDFKLPALTIQPIIENAIKHGLMKLQRGGSIHVTSFESDSHYCVLVTDDGAGFDTSILLDERKHIGLRNIRGRLEAMVNGTLDIESEIGKGTKVTIKIPKEEAK